MINNFIKYVVFTITDSFGLCILDIDNKLNYQSFMNRTRFDNETFFSSANM